MARFAQILTFSGDATVKVTALAAGSASSAQFIGARRVIAVVATGAIHIAFGGSGVAAPTAANYLIPANQQTTLDMGANTYIRVFADASNSAAADIYVQSLEGR